MIQFLNTPLPSVPLTGPRRTASPSRERREGKGFLPLPHKGGGKIGGDGSPLPCVGEEREERGQKKRMAVF